MESMELDGLRLIEQVWNGPLMALCLYWQWSMVVHRVSEGPKGVPDGSQRVPKGVPNGVSPHEEPCLTYEIMAIMANW